ncbi:MAG: Undecaprenyl-phosphate galactose phosphotransferase [Candidatus Woesebacteria bacterium GW2011_GWB1_38_5b]|uniref:Undecaprenyl-phosphate galactose phosphotransferase n=1 Tax=Candidatus Woesebacteria bacterium GW2011_GWB1_38_5b TaxID=1618569 RepID=A0A0G0MPR0_9BACT|nr:MAG: Undecaprenyl-phosphate galactose phosphotransferase [Candidatus Woesebacteria bacterium GW2011_GWB1_38_5b]
MNYEVTKRLIDLVGSFFLLGLFSPILIITAIVIKFTSKGPVFADIPKRVGKDGQLFYPFKFRSMIVNAYELLRSDPKFKKAYEEQQKSGFYKIKNDPRITPIGKFIRKYSIDEMPQLFNVIKGEMSIVGPRPYYTEELDVQQKNYPETKKLVSEVLTAKPGITGFWQVSGRSEVTFDKRIQMDAYYARKKSILLDILILLKTPWVMISGKGAV